MRKWLLGFFILIVLLLGCIYIFIPGDLKISKIAVIRCTIGGAYRIAGDQDQWGKWWPQNLQSKPHKQLSEGTTYVYGSAGYHITEKIPYTIGINIAYEDINLASSISFISLGTDSVIATWSMTYSVQTLNPFKKIKQYQKAKEIKAGIDFLMEKLRSYLNDPVNIYGMAIAKTSTKDTSLIAIRNISNSYPSTTDIYSYIKSLRAYIKKSNAIETSYPMVNITKNDDSTFQTMVAIPTNKVLQDNGNMFYRHMVPGNFFAAEVRGGVYTANKGLDQLYYFMQDYHKTIMAIPFQVLITDRTVEPDTSKWITKIYMPALR